MTRALTLVVALLFLAGLAGVAAAQTPAPAGAMSLDDAVRGLETAYGKITDLKAEFDQTAFNKSLNQSIPAKGTVYLKKGGKLRWEYADPTPKQPLPTIARLILSVDPRSWEVRKAVVYDQFENTVTMQFRKTTINGGLPDSLFAFVAPKGVATVPLR